MYLLLLIPVITAIYVFIQFKTKKQLKKFGDPNLLSALMPDVSPLRKHIKFALLMLALALIILVMARPQFGTRNEEVKRSGIEVVIAVDVSNSMLCEDINPDLHQSRLDKSKMIVSKLIEQFDQDKVGLVAFAGSSITLLPITSDYVSAKMFLSQITPATVSLHGTNMAEAIQRATANFSNNKKKKIGRALILITDAEDNETGAIDAAKSARDQGIQIFVLSVGTEAGGPIPMGGGTFKKDLSGNVVTTKLNEQIGKDIAKASNGLYIHVDQTNEAQAMLEKEIAKMQKEDSIESMYSEYDEQFIAVAILLLIVLILEMCIIEKKNPLFKNFKLFK